ncbi:replication endonuclease [Paraglaciecola sp. L3A3]|uniref:replication endonuclease n=1 Tax=Paraglaciecola sp. L3A3 TaxID=2686358 RepID=UPI00131E2C3F|nr:replication endonuclease [Paraglaciecola sp. L3A3]
MRPRSESVTSILLDSIDNDFGAFYQGLALDDRIFVKKQISHFPNEIQKLLIERYRAFKTLFDANTFLRKQTEILNNLLPQKIIPHFNAGEEELRNLAEANAKRCSHIQIRAQLSKQPCNVTEIDSVKGLNDIYALIVEFVNGYGIAAQKISKTVTLTGVIKRTQDKYWWLRKLRKVLVRKKEEALIRLGQVNSKKGKYCSDLNVKHRKAQKERQLKAMEELFITNEDKESFSLREIYEKNVSNPINRRHELMTRLAGCEELAKSLDCDGVFVTLTCPSKYHNTYARSGDRNPNWQGLTPYDGQQYLNTVWQRIRAELARQNINIFGFRIAEPQHDGTPHWHMIIFIHSEQKSEFKDVINHYALQEDGDEEGAKENRVDFVDIDPSKGSATGYVAKYISKNIDGGNLDSDIDGGNAPEAANRVEAWASCWGVRQFQQIGGVSVTVWRELRKAQKIEKIDDDLVDIHSAADSGNWAKFTELMGGVFCKRNSQAIRPFYDIEMNKETGLIKTSWFDGLFTFKLKGIKYKGNEIITRIHTWILGKAGTAFMPSLGVL